MSWINILEILLEIVVYRYFFGFMWPSGRAQGRARTKMVGPRPYRVYCWRRHWHGTRLMISLLPCRFNDERMCKIFKIWKSLYHHNSKLSSECLIFRIKVEILWQNLKVFIQDGVLVITRSQIIRFPRNFARRCNIRDGRIWKFSKYRAGLLWNPRRSPSWKSLFRHSSVKYHEILMQFCMLKYIKNWNPVSKTQNF